MPTRLIRDGILTSDRVASLSWEAEVFYRRLLSLVDDYGLYDARPSVLRSALYPLQLEKMSECNVQRCLAACETAGLILLFARNGKSFLMVRDFGQSLRSEPKYPLPDGYKAIQIGKSKYQLVTPDDDCSQLQTDANSCSQLCTYADAYSDANAKTNKQENNAEGNNTVVCSNPPAAPALPPPPHESFPGLSPGTSVSYGSSAWVALQPLAEWVKTLRPGWDVSKFTGAERSALAAMHKSLGGVLPDAAKDCVARYLAAAPANASKWDYPPDRLLFMKSFGEVVQKAFTWDRGQPRPKKKPKPEEPRQPEGPVVDTDTAAAEIRGWMKEIGLGGE